MQRNLILLPVSILMLLISFIVIGGGLGFMLILLTVSFGVFVTVVNDFLRGKPSSVDNALKTFNASAISIGLYFLLLATLPFLLLNEPKSFTFIIMAIIAPSFFLMRLVFEAIKDPKPIGALIRATIFTIIISITALGIFALAVNMVYSTAASQIKEQWFTISSTSNNYPDQEVFKEITSEVNGKKTTAQNAIANLKESCYSEQCITDLKQAGIAVLQYSSASAVDELIKNQIKGQSLNYPEETKTAALEKERAKVESGWPKTLPGENHGDISALFNAPGMGALLSKNTPLSKSMSHMLNKSKMVLEIVDFSAQVQRFAAEQQQKPDLLEKLYQNRQAKESTDSKLIRFFLLSRFIDLKRQDSSGQ